MGFTFMVNCLFYRCDILIIGNCHVWFLWDWTSLHSVCVCYLTVFSSHLSPVSYHPSPSSSCITAFWLMLFVCSLSDSKILSYFIFHQNSKTLCQAIALTNVVSTVSAFSLQWHHNERDGVSNHQPHDCLLNYLFRRRSKKTSKLRFTGLCEGNSLGTSEFSAQRASNGENVSISWPHHVLSLNVIDHRSQVTYTLDLNNHQGYTDPVY